MGSSAYMLWLLTWCFIQLLTVGAVVSLTLFPVPGTLCHLLGCLVYSSYEVFGLILLYPALLYLGVVSWRPVLF